MLGDLPRYARHVRSPRYQRQLQEIAASEQVVSIAAPGIVNYVEDGMRDREGVVAYLRRLFAPWQPARFDGVVLGCTHFPFASAEIQEALGGPVRFYEQSDTVARETRRRLAEAGTASEDDNGGGVTIMNSANEKTMLSFSWQLFSTMSGCV